MAASLRKQILGTMTTVLNTGATLTNNALALASAFNNTVGSGSGVGTGDGFPFGRLTWNYTFGVAPTANTGLSVWFLQAPDGTDGTYEDGGASVMPARGPDLTIGVGSSPDTSAHQVSKDALLPAGYFKVLVKNDGTGQTMSSGWTLKLLPFTEEMV
jgi:hypothetical protein